MNEDIKKRILNAIENTKRVIPGYLEKTLERRNPGTSVGSVFERSVSIDSLKDFSWEKAEFKDVQEGCEAFITYSVGGFLGIVELSYLPQNANVRLDDEKNTGYISAIVDGQRGDYSCFSTLIIGKEKEEEVVFTVHPGMPIKPSSVKAKEGMKGDIISVKEAISLGLTFAKIA